MKVNTQQLMQNSDEMRFLAAEMDRIDHNLLQVFRNIKGESITQMFALPVADAVKAVEHQISDLTKLSRALDMIAQTYERTEERILDHEDSAQNEDGTNGFFADFRQHIIVGPGGMLDFIIPRDIFKLLFDGVDTMVDWIPWDGT